MNGMNRRQAYTLYFCHLLSAWNARCYEFSSVLFIHAAYPGGLRAVSYLGIATSLAIVLFGSSLGRWIDNATTRLQALLTTIAVNRAVIISACILWFLIVEESGAGNVDKRKDHASLILLRHRSGRILNKESILQGRVKDVAFAGSLILGVIETLSRRLNVISISRDWVPVLAPPDIEKLGQIKYPLVKVDSTMAGINMACELLAPFVISGFLALIGSMRTAVISIAVVNSLSVWLEFAAAKSIAEEFEALKNPKKHQHIDNTEDETEPLVTAQRQRTFSWISRPARPIIAWFNGQSDSLRLYFSNDIWMASFAFAVLHTSLLSISSTTVVFLLSSGYSLRLITIAEAVSASFEFTSTIVTPFAVGRLNKSAALEWEPIPTEESLAIEERETEEIHKPVYNSTSAIARVGLCGILWQFLSLIPTLPLFLCLTATLSYPISREDGAKDVTFHSHPILSVTLLFCLAASRLGRGTFGLASTQLAQARVPSTSRASFAGVEISLGQIFGLIHSLATATWSSPRDYGWLACVSFIAVSVSTAMYTKWFIREWREEQERSRSIREVREDSQTQYGTFNMN